MFKNNKSPNNPEVLLDDVFESTAKKEPRKVPLYATVIAVILAIVLSFATSIAIYIVRDKNLTSITNKLAEVDALINANYIGDVDYNELEDAVIESYMYAIGDKYSFYQSGDDAKAVADSFEGDTSGIGITVAFDKSTNGLYVTKVDADAPAEKAGIRPNDIITHIDGKSVADLGYESAVNSIQRELGKTVELTVLRNNKTLKLTATYSEFIRQSVYYHTVNNVGYICFTAFNAATTEQFKVAINDLTSKNVKGIVFDVRGNGGGTVESVNEILDILLPKCDIMSVEYKDGKKEVLYTSDSDEINLPFAVLTDGETASAAELFAAAIRDVKKGKLIGETTYGKGVMQSTYFLSDGSCVRFTVAKFFPPSGNSFDGKGLNPDYKITYTEEQADNFYKLGDNDPAIVKAVEVLNG